MTNEERERENFGPDSKSLESYFVQLVLSFHAAAWQQMGKVANIMSGKIERDLNMAKHSIDMLGMLEEKTKGNLTEDEEKYLKHTLYVSVPYRIDIIEKLLFQENMFFNCPYEGLKNLFCIHRSLFLEFFSFIKKRFNTFVFKGHCLKNISFHI